jgi:sulfatase maturation enzyme AslB (radical SAM superfamily)
LHPDIGEAMLDANNLGIKLGLLTNGVLLEGALGKVCTDCCTWIRISMDGWDPISYAEYRRCKPSDYDKLLNNIISADKKSCTIGVNIIVDKKNAPHLADMIMKLHYTGVRSIKLSPCISSNDAAVNKAQHAGVAEIVNEQLKMVPNDVNVYNSYHLELDGFQKSYTWCPYIQILPIIGADQNVYVCHDKAYNNDGILGSIKDQTFRKMWTNGKEKFYKINPAIHCDHHCVTDNTNKMLLEYLAVEHEDFA